MEQYWRKLRNNMTVSSKYVQRFVDIHADAGKIQFGIAINTHIFYRNQMCVYVCVCNISFWQKECGIQLISNSENCGSLIILISFQCTHVNSYLTLVRKKRMIIIINKQRQYFFIVCITHFAVHDAILWPKINKLLEWSALNCWSVVSKAEKAYKQKHSFIVCTTQKIFTNKTIRKKWYPNWRCCVIVIALCVDTLPGFSVSTLCISFCMLDRSLIQSELM